MISSQLRHNVAAAEGCRLVAYQDTVGVWTLGYGHTAGVHAGMTCTMEQAEAWLDADLTSAQLTAFGLPEALGLDPVRLDALTELIFNLGLPKWRLFVKTRAAIADHEWKAAHDALLASLWASQVGPARSGRIADMLLTGAYS